MNLGVICVVSKLYKKEKHWFSRGVAGGGQGGTWPRSREAGSRARGPKQGAFLWVLFALFLNCTHWFFGRVAVGAESSKSNHLRGRLRNIRGPGNPGKKLAPRSQ